MATQTIPIIKAAVSLNTLVGADYRWVGAYGIARFASEVLSRLALTPVAGLTPLLHPLDPVFQAVAVRKSGCKLYFSPGFNAPLTFSTPCVFVIHDLIHLHQREERSFTKSLYYKSVVLPAAKRARKVLTVSEFSRTEILQWSGLPAANVEVVGNGISDEFTVEGERTNLKFPYLLYVGNFKPHKNVPRLIEAFAQSGVHKSVHLCLVGKENSRLLALANGLGIGNKIHFLGPQSNYRLAALYRGAEALICPSLYEGFGLPALEAMACGTPSLVARGHSLEEVAGGAAMICDPLNIESIAEGLQRILNDTEMRSVLRSRGLERACKYSWDGVAAAVSQSLQC